MKAKSLLFLTVIAVLVGSCGLNPFPPVSGPGNPITGGQKAKLVVFGGEWCGQCKGDLPFLQSSLRQRLGAAANDVSVELWVSTGKTPSAPPYVGGPEYYRDLLKLNAKAVMDGEPNKKPVRWPKFVELFPNVRRELPAAVLFRADGTIYKKFPPGQDTFNPADIVATVAEVLNK